VAEGPFTEDGGRGYERVADDLVVANLAEAQRAAEVRTGFMRALVLDSRVVRLFRGWLDRTEEAARAGTTEDLTFDDVVAFVLKDLEIRWPWCAVELLTAYHRMCSLKTIDAEQIVPAKEVAIAAPSGVAMRCATRVGETVDEAWARLDAAFLATRLQLDAVGDAGAAGGRTPRADASYLRTWGLVLRGPGSPASDADPRSRPREPRGP
jgi:hypothetical protein